jgi:hypothetical protein
MVGMLLNEGEDLSNMNQTMNLLLKNLFGVSTLLPLKYTFGDSSTQIDSILVELC